jgi:hypothetical protein
MVGQLTRPPMSAGQSELTGWSGSERAKLRNIVRYHPVTGSHISCVANTYHDQVEPDS